jgi:photosystem II stability/assembly factor-like uncharacterized protein
MIAQEKSFSVVDLFRTMDSGAHWLLTTRIDVRVQFGQDLAVGLSSPNGVVDHRLPGQFLFTSSRSGWYFTPSSSPPTVFHTLDGGLTWHRLAVPTVKDVSLGGAAFSGLTFFNDREGILQLTTTPIGPKSHDYLFTTTDGGDHWADPITGAHAAIHPIDMTHWVGWPAMGGWMRTSDGGQHWDLLSQGHLPSYFDFPTPIDFPDPLHGWAMVDAFQAGGGFALYGTSDGGANWTPLNLPELG